MSGFDFIDVNRPLVDRTTPEERKAQNDLGSMFNAESSEADTFQRGMDFHGMTRSLGLSQIQVDALAKNETLNNANMSWGQYRQQFTEAAKSLGISDRQISALLRYDRENNWR